MSQAKKVTLLLGGLGIAAAVVLSVALDTPEAQSHREFTNRLDAGEFVPGGRFLDSRTGAALERTVKQVISHAGYDCDSIRTIGRMEAHFVARLGAQDGRWVDCNEDGVFGVIESADGFRAVKR